MKLGAAHHRVEAADGPVAIANYVERVGVVVPPGLELRDVRPCMRREDPAQRRLVLARRRLDGERVRAAWKESLTEHRVLDEKEEIGHGAPLLLGFGDC